MDWERSLVVLALLAGRGAAARLKISMELNP